MAAVLCLIFIPLVASIGFIVGSASGLVGVLAATTFFLLGAGLLVGVFNLSRGWEEEKL